MTIVYEKLISKSSFICEFAEYFLMAGTAAEKEKITELHKFNNAGIFILISSKEIDLNDIMDSYYTRQTVEQVFGVAKSDLDLLPIRCHSNSTIRGYLFLQFLLLIVFFEIGAKLNQNFTVD